MKNKFGLITSIISLALIVCFAVFLFISWGSIPEIVPTHFDGKGVANDFGSKSTLLIEMGIMVGVLALLAVIEQFPQLWNMPVEVTAENKARIYLITSYMIGILKILVVGIIMMGILSSIYTGFPVWAMYILIGLIMAVIIAGIIACIVNR